ncbi:hypothetical protein EV360DRAFT_66092 [Lentinula raphanica]|nr:hypothetical protein EV360DRAFT_66092 [Lentinula raphanica]
MLTETLLRQFKYCNEVGCYPVLALVTLSSEESLYQRLNHIRDEDTIVPATAPEKSECLTHLTPLRIPLRCLQDDEKMIRTCYMNRWDTHHKVGAEQGRAPDVGQKEVYGIVLHKATSHQRRKIELNTNARLPDWVLLLLRTNEVIVLLSRKVACWNHSKDVKAITPDPTPGHWENILKDKLRTLVKQKKGNEGKRGIAVMSKGRPRFPSNYFLTRFCTYRVLELPTFESFN